MSNIITSFANIFRFHKKKILFLFAAFIFCFVILFPYDDLSDLITQQISVATNSNVYVQFDNLSFGLLPQLGLKMANVSVESIFAPNLKMKSLGFAPTPTAIFGSAGGKLVANGLFGGDATVSVGSSNELDIDGKEYEVDLDIDELQLKDLTRFLKSSYNLPFTAKGLSQIESTMYVDPTFKEQPKGDVEIYIQKMDIPSTSIPLGAFMSYSLPAIKLSKVRLVGKIGDRKLAIKEGKIGDAKDDLHGTLTGEFDVDIRPGGRVEFKGYDLKVNMNVSDNLKQQLQTVLGFVDIYQGIGEKYKFDSLKGVRYSMSLTSRSMQAPPRISSF